MSSSSATKKIAIVGSTGQQGSNIIKALLNDTQCKYRIEIIGLTRNPDSSKCKALKTYESKQNNSNKSLSFIKSDIENQQQLEKSFINCWAVFCVTTLSSNETENGKKCIDAAINSQVSYFVYSSVSSANTETIPHFISKYMVEKYLTEKAKHFVDGYAILRPVFFYDNFLTFNGPKNGYIQMPMNGTVKLQMTSCKDIGIVVADHLLNGKQTETFYDIAFDELTPTEIAEIISNVSGSKIQFSNVSVVLKILNLFPIEMINDLMAMFKWFEDEGYSANIEKCKSDYSNYLLFEDFCKIHFKDKDLSEPISRKIIKYGVTSMVIGGIGTAVWYIKKRYYSNNN